VRRPTLNSKLSAEDFQRWYWLKEELSEYCRVNNLSRSGSKPDIALRIIAHLSGEKLPPTTKVKKKGNMPLFFKLSDVIGRGWKCNPSLGAFFREHCGAGFRFNAAIRNFVHTQAGSSLQQAVECYRASVAPGAPKQEIIPQNEYNRHTREFYQTHPKATRSQVLEAWWAKRNSEKN
jgi:SAP domain-containing new25